MSFTKQIRRTWHDVYYFCAGVQGVEFAMRCRDVAHQIDQEKPRFGTLAHSRMWLHLSLCQSCKYYFEFSRLLKKSALKVLRRETKSLSDV